jgi:2-aminoadipate transaminase
LRFATRQRRNVRYACCDQAGVDARVERLQRQGVTQPGILSLAGGLPASETFPVAELARSLGCVGPSELQYDWPEGRQRLREWIAARLTRRGARVSPDDVLVTSGAQQALDMAIALSGPGVDSVAVPSACYPGALDLFRARGLRLTDDARSAPLIYAMPVVANPTGLALPSATSEAWLAARSLVLEDDAYAELRFDGQTPPPLLARAAERAFHVGTLSKTLCPGLRIGWLVVPAHLREKARREKQLADVQGNTFAQRIVEGYLAQNDYERRLERLRRFYALRAEALAAALRKHVRSCSFAEPQGGFSIWLEVDAEGDDVGLLRLALQYGTSFDPGRDFRFGSEQGRLCLRLAFSSLAPHAIPEAVQRLARALAEYRRGASAATRG